MCDLLNEADLPQAANAERTYLPDYDTASESELITYVVATGEKAEASGRALHKHTYSVVVAIYKRIDREDIDSIGAMDDFRQAVLDALKPGSLPSYPDASLVGLTNNPIYDPETLGGNSVYLSLISADYISVR